TGTSPVRLLPRRSRQSSGWSALPCQSLQARVNRLVGAHRCAGLQRSSVLMQQADGFLIGAMVRGGTWSPTVCTKLGPDAALVPPPRQATTYKRLQPRAFRGGDEFSLGRSDGSRDHAISGAPVAISVAPTKSPAGCPVCLRPRARRQW